MLGHIADSAEHWQCGIRALGGPFVLATGADPYAPVRKAAPMSTPVSRSTSPGTRGRPWTASVVAVLVGAEALALLVGACALLVSLFGAHVLPVPGILFAAVVLLGGALWLAAASRDTWRGRRWPRAAVLVSQAFLLVVGLSLLQTGLLAWGVVVAAVAAVTILCLFAPPSVAWMHRTRDDAAR